MFILKQSYSHSMESEHNAQAWDPPSDHRIGGPKVNQELV